MRRAGPIKPPGTGPCSGHVGTPGSRFSLCVYLPGPVAIWPRKHIGASYIYQHPATAAPMAGSSQLASEALCSCIALRSRVDLKFSGWGSFEPTADEWVVRETDDAVYEKLLGIVYTITQMQEHLRSLVLYHTGGSSEVAGR